MIHLLRAVIATAQLWHTRPRRRGGALAVIRLAWAVTKGDAR